MELSEYGFFRDATLQICSSLDIEKALFNFLHYIRSFIPASHMVLSLFEPSFSSKHQGFGRKSKSKSPLPGINESVDAGITGVFVFLGSAHETEKIAR